MNKKMIIIPCTKRRVYIDSSSSRKNSRYLSLAKPICFFNSALLGGARFVCRDQVIAKS